MLLAQWSTPLRQNLKLNKKLTLNLNLIKTTKFRVRVSFRFWLSVYSAWQTYRWLIFLAVPIVT